MSEQKSEVINKTAKYLWNRIKIISLMVFLIIIVKEHPGWDTFFGIVLILQVLLIALTVLALPKTIKKEEEKNYQEQKKRYQYTWNNYSYNYNKQKAKVFNDTIDVNKSSQILGINLIQDNNEIIKKKYRKLALKWHPDKFANDTNSNQEIAKRNFQKVNGAYQIIKKYKNIK